MNISPRRGGVERGGGRGTARFLWEAAGAAAIVAGMSWAYRFRYDSLWARLIACLATANVVWPAVGWRAMALAEDLFARSLLARSTQDVAESSTGLAVALVFLLCLLPSLLRVDRPMALIGLGVAGAAVYATLYAATGLIFDFVLPLAAPLLGLACSVAVLGTMAWSEERQRRRELARMEEAKQRFTDMLVHDLKGRMSSIGISLSMLEKEMGGREDKLRPLFAAMRSSSMRMLMQIHALLDIRRMQEGALALQRRHVAMAHVISESIEEQAPLADLCGVRLEQARKAGDNALVDADPEVLLRVMANLLWNAIRSAPRGGAVQIALERQPRTVVLSVSNGGAVIPEAEQAGLFQPFVSHVHAHDNPTSAGTGLGLVFCKLAVEAHGGSIRLESPRLPEGDGVRVTVALPVALS